MNFQSLRVSVLAGLWCESCVKDGGISQMRSGWVGDWDWDWFEEHTYEKTLSGERFFECRHVCEKDSAKMVKVFITEVSNTLSFHHNAAS